MRRIVRTEGPELLAEAFGRGPDLVFAHGLSSCRAATRAQFRPLARSHRIVSFDQRGHGSSSLVKDPALFDPHLMAADIGAVMDALGIERAVVGGESMGAATALLFALANPSRVKALLLTAPALGDRPSTEGPALRAMADLLEKEGMRSFVASQAREMRDEGSIPEKGIRLLSRLRRANDAGSLALACRVVIDWVILEDLADLASLPFPVCILCWPDDPLHPLELAERMAREIRACTLVRIPSIAEIFVDPPSVGRRFRDFLGPLGLYG